MALAPSFYNQSSVLSINIMVVDDDPIFLKTFSRKLEKSKCRDPSVMEITVIPEKGPMEALTTLKVQQNNIDLIITDYYMPEMNGIQLKNQITQEFGNLPVLVMSVDKEKEQESLTSGALGFFPKPIKTTDLPRIYQFALTYRRNGKSIMSSTELNQDTHVSIPKQIKLLPDPQANVVKTKKRYSDSIKNQKGNPNVGPSDDGEPEPPKKAKFIWTGPRHSLFVQALAHIGHDRAVPKRILEFMTVANVPDLTTKIIASHLQKYRRRLRKQVVEPWSNHFAPSTWYDRGLNDGSFYANSEYGLSQSRLTPEPVRFSQMPYMNRSSNYDLHSIGSGSNFTLPIRGNHFLPDQPFVMDNKMDQASQLFGFGLLGPTDITGNNFNNDMMSSFGSFASNQPGSSHFSYGSIRSFFNSENSDNFNNDMMSSYGNFASNQPGSSHFSYGSIQSFLNNENPQPHASSTTQPNYELPQMDNLHFYSDLDQTNELHYNITSNSDFYQQQQGEDVSTKFDLSADFLTELNQILSEDQGHFNGESSDASAATESNPPISNQNHYNGEASNTVYATETNQEEEDVSGFNLWSSLDSLELIHDDFMKSPFTDMN